MSDARAAARARSRSRLATARNSARGAKRNAGSRRWLIFATPRIPQHSFGNRAMVRRPRSRVSSESLYNTGMALTRTGPSAYAENAVMCLLALFFRAVDDAPVVV